MHGEAENKGAETPESESDERPTSEGEGPTSESETEGEAESETEESRPARAPRRRAAARPRERVSAGMAVVRKDVGQARFALVAVFAWALLVVALQVGVTWTPERLLSVANLRGVVPDSPERILRALKARAAGA